MDGKEIERRIEDRKRSPLENSSLPFDDASLSCLPIVALPVSQYLLMLLFVIKSTTADRMAAAVAAG